MHELRFGTLNPHLTPSSSYLTSFFRECISHLLTHIEAKTIYHKFMHLVDSNLWEDRT